MVEITAKDTVLASAVILLIISLGVNINDLVDQSPPWYYCEIENTLQQCSSLTSYGIPDAKCVIANPEIVGKTSDICTMSGVRQAWKPITDYVNIEPTKEQIVIEALQDCTNTTYQEEVVSYKINEFSEFNKTTSETDYWNTTEKVISEIDKIRTQCEPRGYRIKFPDGSSKDIEGECCGYFKDSPYKQYEGMQVISCKQTEGKVCNPLIQQTSGDSTEYDQLGKIYVISGSDITQDLVGEYDYVKKVPVSISTIKITEVEAIDN